MKTIYIKDLENDKIFPFETTDNFNLESQKYENLPQDFLNKSKFSILDAQNEEVLDLKFKEKQDLLISSRVIYLKSTDWRVIKELDEPNSYSQDIKNKRSLAREEINLIEECKSLEELSQFSIEF